MANARAAAVSLAIVVASLAAFQWVASPWLRARMGGQEVLDVIPWRSPDDVLAALEAYGPSGRKWYRRYLAADALFPLLYGPLLTVSVAFAAGQLRLPRPLAGVAPWLAVAGAVSDWGENLFLWHQADRFPDLDRRIGWIAAALTASKFTALVAAVLLSLAGLACAMCESRRGSSGA